VNSKFKNRTTTELLRNGNPHIQDQYFMIMIRELVQYWLIETMGAKYYFIRFEFQYRNKPHCHGVAWLEEPESGLVKLAETAKEGKEA
jgi:hypothetical protein